MRIKQRFSKSDRPGLESWIPKRFTRCVCKCLIGSYLIKEKNMGKLCCLSKLQTASLSAAVTKMKRSRVQSTSYKARPDQSQVRLAPFQMRLCVVISPDLQCIMFPSLVGIGAGTERISVIFSSSFPPSPLRILSPPLGERAVSLLPMIYL